MSVLTFQLLRVQNAARKLRWHGTSDAWIGSDWSNAMAGEAGEACNVVKKLRRHETHIESTYNTPAADVLHAALAKELADVVIYADLLAHYYEIDLGSAVRDKFNEVSAAQGFPEQL